MLGSVSSITTELVVTVMTEDPSVPTICLDVLYRDESICVINKPAQMLMHRSPIATSDTVFVLQCARDQFGRHVWPVHRLDRGTSGALILAFEEEAARRLGRDMMDGSIKKRYAAIVRGWLNDSALIDHPIKPTVDPYVKNQKTDPQDARTIVKPLARAELPIENDRFPSTRVGLLSLELLTGRRHQIRKHMKTISHPIIGDATYGKGWLNRAMAGYFGVDRLMLHCARLQFRHPVHARLLDVRAPLDGRMGHVVDVLGWNAAYETLSTHDWMDASLDALQRIE